MLKKEQTTDVCHTMDDALKIYWVKEALHKKESIIWFPLCKIVQQAKPIYGETESEKQWYRWGVGAGVYWDGPQGNYLDNSNLQFDKVCVIEIYALFEFTD